MCTLESVIDNERIIPSNLKPTKYGDEKEEGMMVILI